MGNQHFYAPGYLRELADELIGKMNLSLDGLTIYTEAASGAYLLSPVLAAAAGASKVYAQTRNSRFGTAEKVMHDTRQLAVDSGVSECVEITDSRRLDWLAESDIITNSGFVRPIDRELVTALKETAVIPLMWETWEFRESDFDLAACKERGILVLGTVENREPCHLIPYCGFIALKLLFAIGFDGRPVLVLGNAPYPGGSIVSQLRGAGMEVVWFSAQPESDYRYSDLRAYFKKHGQRFGNIILAEHVYPGLLLGSSGYLDMETIKTVNPRVRIGLICGNVDADELKQSGLVYAPEQIAPFGFMSYQPYELGPRPVQLLYAAGLKVGEAMARARLAGLTVKEAAKKAIENSPAMDFKRGLAWL